MYTSVLIPLFFYLCFNIFSIYLYVSLSYFGIIVTVIRFMSIDSKLKLKNESN